MWKQSNKVSNPWREAIEGQKGIGHSVWLVVSNPWREAIEAVRSEIMELLSYEFPILGGRLLKKGTGRGPVLF